jgi:O-antigen ligase
LAALPWLVPVHSGIWPSFYGEVLTALLGSAIAVGMAMFSASRWRVPWLAVVFGLAALLPLMTLGHEGSAAAHPALLPSLYLAAFAMALVAGASDTGDRLAAALLGSLLLAALVSTAMALAQFLDLGAGLWVMKTVPGQRPFANLGQPNNLATLLVWGLAALWWGWHRKEVGVFAGTLASLFLLLGLLVTGSRTGLLGALFVALCAARAPQGESRRISRLWLACMACGLGAATLAWPRFAASLAAQSVRAIADKGTVDSRLSIWRQMGDAVSRHPWLGWGWDEIGRAHMAVVEAHPPVYTFVRYGHNLFLDFVLWAGIPIGLLLSAALCLWLWRRARVARDKPKLILLAATGAFMLHAQLELPHAYLYFIVPLGLMMGSLDARLASPSRSIGRPAFASAALCALLLSVASLHDYAAIEAEQFAARLRAERIANAPEPETPRPIVLKELQRHLHDLQVMPRAGMNPADMARLEDAIDTFPAGGAMVRLAQSLYLNGRPLEADAVLDRLCRINQPRNCDEARMAWAAWRRSLPVAAS